MNQQILDHAYAPPTARPIAAVLPLHVAVEATRLAREVRGIGRYVRALLPRLVAQRPGLTLTLYVKRQRDIEFLTPSFSAPELAGRIRLGLVRDMTRCDADVFWFPWNTASPTPARGAIVTTVHDIVPIVHPDPRLRGWQKNFRWRRRYANTARRSTLIMTVSQFTADEVHRMLRVPYSRMRVARLAADDFAAPAPAALEALLDELGVTRPFVLAVGAADRRKNLALLERAMPAVVAAIPDATLVLAGPRREVPAALGEPWARTLGFVGEDQLAALYSAASVLVQPSTYEGFGLPVLEAMQLGTPVIATQTSSLPEVAGDAALYVDPENDVELAAMITQIMTDPALAARLRTESLAQAARFSWAETARQVIGTFEEAFALAGRKR